MLLPCPPVLTLSYLDAVLYDCNGLKAAGTVTELSYVIPFA